MAKDPYKQMMFMGVVHAAWSMYIPANIINAWIFEGFLSWFQLNVVYLVCVFTGLIYYADDGKYNG